MELVKYQLSNIGMWFAADSRRIMMLLVALAVLTALSLVLLNAAAADPDLLLIVENSPGGSG